MPVLNVRSNETPHLSVNPHIRRDATGKPENYLEYSHIGTLVNADIQNECVARDILRARREAQPDPTYTQKSLKEITKVYLRAWGFVGVKLWRDGLSDEDIAEVLNAASQAGYRAVPDLWDGVADKPELPPEEPTTEVATTDAAEGSTEIVVRKPPASDLTAADLNDMSRGDLIVEYRARGGECSDKISGTKVRNLLLARMTASA